MKKNNEKEEQNNDFEPQTSGAESSTIEKNSEIEKLKALLSEEKAKTKYMATPAPIPENQMGLPKGIQDSQIKTTIRDMSNIIQEKMLQLKDMATMEIFLDTHVRMKKRLKSIKDMGSAESIKIQGNWKTIAPAMYITKLEGKKISNDEFEITFGVWETDEAGNKKLYTHYADVLLHDGSVIKRPTSAEYRVGYEITETIKRGKPITRQVINLDAENKGVPNVN